MVLNSCLYECKIGHIRTSPKKHSFSYGLFTFYLDLDEIKEIEKQNFFFSVDKFNLFSFYSEDHFTKNSENLKESIIQFAKDSGLNEEISRVTLLTHTRILGYTFNPVCFFYLFDKENNPIASVIEVHNTFGEMKPFLALLQGDEFYLKSKKFFYVSPFFNLDTEFEFRLKLPSEKLQINIDDFLEGNKVFYSNYKGIRKVLNNGNLIFYFLKYPLITFRIIFLIHYQAFILFLKKIPFHKKMANPELQQGVYLGKNS